MRTRKREIWERKSGKYENSKVEIRAYLSSSQPNRDLTIKGLKEDFSWISSTQVLSRCSRLGELTTACWGLCWCCDLPWYINQYFRDLGRVEIWGDNPICAHAGPPVVVVDVVGLAITVLAFVHRPSIPALFFGSNLVRVAKCQFFTQIISVHLNLPQEKARKLRQVFYI